MEFGVQGLGFQGFSELRAQASTFVGGYLGIVQTKFRLHEWAKGGEILGPISPKP